MASSCVPAGLRLDLEMVKAAAAGAAPTGAHSAPLRAAHSSALSEASNSSTSSSLSLKRARTPRKRPNQTYNEAAALLASMYPSVFPVNKSSETAPPRLLGLASALADDPAYSDLLPPFPVLGNSAFLLRDMPQPPPPPSPVPIKSCPSPAAVSSVFREFRDPAPSPGTPEVAAAAAAELGELDFDDDDGFDADSFLGVEEGPAEGIDDIMGKLSMESNATTASDVIPVLSSSGIHPSHLRSLIVLGLGFRHGRPNMNQALKRHDDDSEWWMCPAMLLKDIMPAPPPSVALPAASEKKKKSKKKVEKVLGREKDVAIGQCRKDEGIPDSANGDAGISVLKMPKTGLGLNLNAEEVLKAWCNRGSVFSDSNAPDSPRSSTDVLAKLADIDLFLENGAGGVIREGSMLKMCHKQKQCTPLLSNQTRYQARKVNVECRPRVKALMCLCFGSCRGGLVARLLFFSKPQRRRARGRQSCLHGHFWGFTLPLYEKQMSFSHFISALFYHVEGRDACRVACCNGDQIVAGKFPS